MVVAICLLFGFALAAVVGVPWSRVLARHARGTEILGGRRAASRVEAKGDGFWEPAVPPARDQAAKPPPAPAKPA